MALLRPRFLTAGRNSQNGLAGYLQRLFSAIGKTTVLNGQTSITVVDPLAKVGDVILASVLTAGANPVYVVGTSIIDNTSFTINVSGDPGAGGAVIAFARFQAQVLFPN